MQSLRFGNLRSVKLVLTGNLYSYSTMLKPIVFVTRSDIPECAIDLLKASCDVRIWPEAGVMPKEDLLSNVKEASGLLCTLSNIIDKTVLENARNLKVVATMSVGFDHIDRVAAKAKHVRVGHTPHILTDAVAELTIALLLATSRRMVEADQEVRNGKWCSWAPQYMCGPGLINKTIGIVGFGGIGQACAKILKGFSVGKIIFFNRSERAAAAAQIGAQKVDFDTLLRSSDFVIVTCALAPETKGLISESALSKMKPSAILVNTSRGAVVDEAALIKALENETIAGAGLDVMENEPLALDSPLMKFRNCVLLPHIGSATYETRKAMALLAANNILSALNGKPMPAEVVIS